MSQTSWPKINGRWIFKKTTVILKLSRETKSYANFPFNFMWLMSFTTVRCSRFSFTMSLEVSKRASWQLLPLGCLLWNGSIPRQPHQWQEQPEEVLIFAEDRSICAQVARTGYQTPTTHLYLCKSSDQSSVISLWEHPCSQPPSSMAH